MQVPFRRYIEEMITVPQTLDSLGNETYLQPAAPIHTSLCLMGGCCVDVGSTAAAAARWTAPANIQPRAR
jgi:hypothetical protein